MPLPVIANAWRIICEFTGGTGSSNWSTHFDYRDNTQLGSTQDLATAFENAFELWWVDGGTINTETRDFYTISQAWSSYTIYPLDGISAPTVFTPSPALAGTGTATGQMPPDVALVTSLRTSSRGPRGRGRQYWQPRVSIVNANGIPDAPARQQHGVEVFNFFSGLTGALDAYQMVVIGRQAEGSGVLVARNVLSATCDAHFDTQRRRGLG